MPPLLHPPHLHFHKLKKRARAAAGTGAGSPRPAAKARKGLAAMLYKLRDVHRPPSPSSPPSPAITPQYRKQLCYPPPPSTWPWPSCRHPRTSSFRARHHPDQDAAAAVYRTANAVYDASSEHFVVLRRSSVDEAFWPGLAAAAVDQEPEEEEETKELRLRETAVVRGVRSERLFFEPAGAEFFLPTTTQAKTEAATTTKNEDVEAPPVPAESSGELKGGAAVVVTVESENPYGDFRESMAEMVAAHGVRDWEGLEELLACYLKLNAKGVHAVIVGAFVDMLLGLAASSPPTSPSPSSSCITFEGYSSATLDEEDKS
ncbi:transcription repressor OFP13 [Brachypodium distachyon]|uniref:Transcription repressor n=1 Tax=Brachypodium distachyon TaxID=15368 RepID=A0A0Q3KR94_BRADI|nr:transcription repressor OFP13 [Brachypodium distachyon]KQJ82541.1 hypothetical protein BRADI_5g09557v3 [Brachypodium distachyon]|eukprot:XP_003581214.1 transcription repressor OFP13 [Brachypodium distachyon]